MNQVLFNIRIFSLFLILVKKFNNSKSLPFYYNIFNTKFFNLVWVKQYIYIFIFKSLKLNLIYLLNNKFYTKDYYILILLESFTKFNNGLFRKNSKFFSVYGEKRIIPYKNFKFRVPWIFYISMGPQIEYFRYFLFLQYMKTCIIKPEMKHVLCEQAYRHLALWRQHSISLSDDKYIFFETNREQVFTVSKLFINNFLFTKKYIVIFWEYIFSINHKNFKKYFDLWKFFFHLPLVSLNYKFIWLFVRQLEIFNKFKNLTPYSLFITLKYLSFDVSKWIIIYSLRDIILKFNLWDQYYLPIPKNNTWLYILEICLFEIYNNVHFHRLLIQFDKDHTRLIKPLFLILWEVFIEFYYFDLTSIDNYYSNFKEFEYWISLFKYNLECLLCEIFWLAGPKLKSSLMVQKTNEYYYNQKKNFASLFAITYKKFFFKSRLNKGKNIFFFTQFESLILKYYFNKFDSRFYFHLFKFNQFKERKWFLYEYIYVYKWNLFFKLNSEFEFIFPYMSGKWPKRKRNMSHIYYIN